MSTTDIRVPDIGDFSGVPVIEILVKPGDKIKKNDSLIALESEKATMEVPSPEDGTVEELKVQVGDKVSQGSVILSLSTENGVTESPSKAQGDKAENVANHTEASASHSQASASHGQASASHAEVSKHPEASKGPPQLIDLTVPDIGDFKDVPVIEVLIKPGDRIEKDASLVALESEKATIEVPASAAGTIADVRVKVGDKVAQGTVIATLETQSIAPSIPQGASIPQHDEMLTRAKTEPPVQRAAVVTPAPTTPAVSGNGEVHASPSIRRFARELGVDLRSVEPSGPNRRVTREDVQQFVKHSLKDGGSAPTAAQTAGLQIAPWPKVDFAQYGEIERKPLSRIQKISGPNLHRNWVMIPHVTQDDDADVTELEAFRAQLNGELTKSGVKITMLAFLIKASIAALQKYPQFNSSLDGDDLVFKKYFNIGFAADTPNGLIVPVIKNADRKGIADLARETAELAGKARDGKLALSAMQGGTFTISSLGSIGGTYFTPIINAPEVAILGACRASMRPVWNGSQFEPRLMQPLSLSYDHRVIDGAAAARFTSYLASVLSDLRRALI